MARKFYNIPNPVYPDIDMDKYVEIKKKLGGFDVEVNFLFDDGISFSYPPERLETKNNPGNVSFYDSKTKARLLTYIEDFDQLLFKDSKDEIILTIPILEDKIW